MIIYSKKYGYRNVFIDKDDYEKVKNIRWHIDKGRNTFYCKGHLKNKNIKLHKFILDYKGSMFIDHINRNGLDNRKANLRLIDNSINQKNRKSNSKIFPNVTYRIDKNGKARFVVYWKENGNRKSKSYSIEKHGYRKALNKAIIKSIKERKKNGYIVEERIVKVKRIK